MLKHGGCGTRLYRIWYDMRRRCSYEKSINWHLYGGRGIKVCDEWESDFESFRNWAIENGYSESLTLDRINNDGNYEPSNCRWATADEQNANKRTCVNVTIEGETKTVTEWCKETGVDRMVAYKRIRNGWEPSEAVTTRDPSVGKKRMAESKQKKVSVDGVVYQSVTEAAAAIGSSLKAVSYALRSGGKTKGHEVKYA